MPAGGARRLPSCSEGIVAESMTVACSSVRSPSCREAGASGNSLVLRDERPAFAPPSGGGSPGHLPENLAEMRLIRHTAGQGDVAEGVIAHQHQVTRFLDSSTQDVEVRTDTEGPLEGPRKMRFAALNDGAEVG